jgi:hypothetical protein
MNDIDRMWQALGQAIRKGASEKQINGIAARINRAHGSRKPE